MNPILWEKFRELIADRIGFRIRSQDTQYLYQKIETRIKILKLSNLKQYYNFLKQDTINNSGKSPEQYLVQKEWKILANTITNGESFFFRDRGQFDLLSQTILPEIIAKKRQDKENKKIPYLCLKIWSAGCSTGEEVYSLAMLVSELITDPAQWQIVIIGTDINQDFLQSARKGIYKQWSFRLTDPFLKTKYFIAEKQNWQIKPHIKSMVSFYRDNLIDTSTISHYNYSIDLVLCRNVFIYFSLDSIKKAIQKITSTLSYGGYFLAGHTELQGVNLEDFKITSFAESIIYQYLPKNQKISSSLIYSKDVSIKPKEDRLQFNKNNLSQTNKDSTLSLSEKSIVFSQEIGKNSKINKIKNSDNRLENKLQEIEYLLENNNYLQVIQEAEQLIEQKQYQKESYYSIAKAYANRGDLKQAQENCDLSLQIDSIYLPALFLAAQIAEEQKNYRKTKEILKKIIYLEPLSVDAYLYLGAIYRNENDLKRSQKMYQTAYNLLTETDRKQEISDLDKAKVKDILTSIESKL